jgi:DNA repair exonuclease SbcCD nuclease subunit
MGVVIMTRPALIVSDCHFHCWNAFSAITANGVNSRLQIQLDELKRAAYTLRKEVDGNLIIGAGDHFHTRGRLQPSVLNPVLELHRELVKDGFEIIVLAGNHDLESRDSKSLTSAVTALGEVGCQIVNEPDILDDLTFCPWIEHLDDLKDKLSSLSDFSRGEKTLIMHAPIDGVIPGLNGLDPKWLEALNFKKIFSGHYHNHKVFSDKVYSVGAMTHQTWGDVGSLAGFLIVEDGVVRHHESQAPKFVRLDREHVEDEEELKALVEGNYVRADLPIESDKEIRTLRDMLKDLGAAGIVVNPIRENRVTRTSTVAASGMKLHDVVTSYVKTRPDHSPELETLCGEILNEALEMSDE